MTQCLSCAHLDLRTFPDHAKTGFGRCGHEKASGVFESITYERDCSRFEQAEAETTEKRRTWWAKLKEAK